ncbi:ABC transporter substrate-binding protein [Streptomyces sp. V3I7]|uniref:ABC transporter substrate-binding protein n=1 Tax=Streptomyces sp. V3I7 TaxID=3042278 RepID=UPI002780C4BB|nr:ABC transporter substrate-binding protein [Streptomyces sp. V3I7]MDQ0989500.1 peptide/nickel transport system substrate-binding protein [Streptomyces sp. V3I7]
MSRPTSKASPATALSLLTIAALALSACSGGSPSGAAGAAGGRTLVIDTSFNLKTADPGREFEPTGQIVDKALYQTLLTFKGGDVTKPVPELATYEQSADGKKLTLHLKAGARFSDGGAVTADDVVFSLNRVIGLKGNPSFLLDGVTVTKTAPSTVTLTSKKANPALPYILPNPALGILNSKTVKAKAGSDTPGDKAETYLNAHSAGSGPYTLTSFNTNTQVVLEKNPKYTGAARPAYDKVVIRNVQGPTQKLNVQRGDSQIALDLTSDQVQGLTGGLKVLGGTSSDVIFLLLNQDKKISSVTSNAKFAEAVRKGVDYASLLSLSGKGSVQAAGIIPSTFVGSLPAARKAGRDVAGAKAALAASGVKKPSVTLGYPSDLTVDGLSLQTIAERVQAQLKEVGITVDLAPAPTTTELDKYRNGKEEMGLWYWGPDYPDPSDYLAFLPGNLVGLRAGWKTGADAKLTDLGEKAATTTDDSARAKLYEEIQTRMNASGPFVPLLQPSRNTVTAATVTGVAYNPVWTIDVAAVGSK